jgi:hypothetical protein
LHAKKKPSLLFKLNIVRASDSIAWPFLLDVLQHIGIGRAWRDWLSALLSTSST